MNTTFSFRRRGGRVGPFLAALLLASACGSGGDSDTSAVAPEATATTEAAEPAVATGQGTEPATEQPTDAPAPTESATEAPATEIATEPPTEVAVATDAAELAAAALLTAEDLPDGWDSMGEEFHFPNSAELARTVPTCADFSEVVFDGGSSNGVGASATLSKGGAQLVLAHATVFPSEAAAAAALDAVASPEFDQCWADFNEIAVPFLPFGITSATYDVATPPDLDLTADAVSVKFLEGSFELGGTEVPDTCICVFAQVGRGVVEVSATEATLTIEERTAYVQNAIDKMRSVLDDPTAATAGEAAAGSGAIELLESLGLTGESVGEGWTVTVEPHDPVTSATSYRNATPNIETCEGITDIAPIPYDAMVDAAKMDFNQPVDQNDVEIDLVVMPDEAAAITFMEQVRTTTNFFPCLRDVILRYLDTLLPEGFESTADFQRVGEPIPGFGDDQHVSLTDYVITVGDSEFRTIPFSDRYSRVGNLILYVSGPTAEVDTFAANFFELVSDAVANG